MNTNKTNNMNPFHILALSGGGFKGLFTLVILERLEDDFGYPIARKFDLLAGTSIGGIITLALANEIPVKRIKELLLKDKKKIFALPRLLRGYCCHSRYSINGLKEFLFDIFGNQQIKDLKHRIIIPTINYTEGSPQILKTSHHETLKNDMHWPLVHAALATSAAPIYFPFFRSNNGDFIDGGIVANHPGFFAFIEAQKFLGIQPANIFQLHIGTTIHKITSPGKNTPKKTDSLFGKKSCSICFFHAKNSQQNSYLHSCLETDTIR